MVNSTTAVDLFLTRNIFKKYVYDEVPEDIFDISNVRIFKNGGCLYFVFLCSAELSKAFGLRNLSYSKVSAVMLLGAKTRVTTKQNMPCVQMLHI